MLDALKKSWKKITFLFAAGLALALVLEGGFRSKNGAFVSDLCFTVSCVFLCVGLAGLVRNLGVFNSLTYGMKYMGRLLRGKQGSAAQTKEEYYEYVKSRRKSEGVPLMMAFGGVFFALSLIAMFFFA